VVNTSFHTSSLDLQYLHFTADERKLSVHLRYGKVVSGNPESIQIYATFFLSGRRVYKSQLAESRNLVWNEKFDIQALSGADETLSIDVLKWSTLGSKRISSEIINIHDIVRGETKELVIRLLSSDSALRIEISVGLSLQ